MASGVKVSDEVIKTSKKLKLDKHCRYFIFAINKELTEIVMVKEGKRDSTHEEFMNELDEKTPFYCIYDYEYETPDGKRSKLVFITWCPTGAPIKQKMLYSSSKAALKDKIAGFNVEIQATEKWELEKDVIENKCKQFSK